MKSITQIAAPRLRSISTLVALLLAGALMVLSLSAPPVMAAAQTGSGNAGLASPAGLAAATDGASLQMPAARSNNAAITAVPHVRHRTTKKGKIHVEAGGCLTVPRTRLGTHVTVQSCGRFSHQRWSAALYTTGLVVVCLASDSTHCLGNADDAAVLKQNNGGPDVWLSTRKRDGGYRFLWRFGFLQSIGVGFQLSWTVHGPGPSQYRRYWLPDGI